MTAAFDEKREDAGGKHRRRARTNTKSPCKSRTYIAKLQNQARMCQAGHVVVRFDRDFHDTGRRCTPPEKFEKAMTEKSPSIAPFHALRLGGDHQRHRLRQRRAKN